MGCSNCGDSGCGGGSDCGSCADACSPCNGPKTIITKQGLQGLAGNDGRGYDAISAISTDILNTAATGMGGLISVEKAYTPGARVRFSDTANPTVNYFEGIVGTYDPASGAMSVISVDIKAGSGIISSWDVNLAGEPGVDGVSPNPGDDRFGYTTASATPLDLSLFGVAGTNPSITVAVRKSYITGDVVRVQDVGGFYIETAVDTYDPVSGLLTLERLPSVGPKRFGAGVLSSWTVTLINKEQTFAYREYSLAYEAKKVFSTLGTNYIPKDGLDNALFSSLSSAATTGTIMTFDPADPDVTILTDISNNIVTGPSQAAPYSFVEGSGIKFIEVELFLPMTVAQEDLGGNRWITPKNISGTDVFESGSIMLVKHAFNSNAPQGITSVPRYYETHKVSVNKNTGTISIIWRIPYADFQNSGAGPTAIAGAFKFYIQNNTDIDIFGGDYFSGSDTVNRQYSLRIYI